jgi:hypothetical protein
MEINVLDVFCGTKSVKQVCDTLGWRYTGLDIEKKFNPDICIDFLKWDYKKYPKNHWDAIWFSPDCACYSIAARNVHFNADHTPKTDKARIALQILDKVKEVIEYFDCIYYIENPRARMRWFLTYPRYEVWYCRYGFNRAKPTDIWTNVKGFIPKKCHNGNPDHISAPRGSQRGTTGVKKTERYKVPPRLIRDLFESAMLSK